MSCDCPASAFALSALSVTVRPMAGSDADRVFEIAKAALPEPWSKQDYAALPDHTFARSFVAEAEGVLLGFCFLYLIADEGQIMEIAVDKPYRRRRVAQALLSHMIEGAASEGATRFTLEVRSQNLPAIGLYTSFGFTEVGRRKHYYKNPTDDAVLMDRGEETVGRQSGVEKR